MENISVIKIGSTINLCLNGVVMKKVFDSVADANKIYAEILEIKKDQSPTNLKKLSSIFNETKRILLNSNIEFDEVGGKYYLKGYNFPIHPQIVDVIKDYDENNFPMDAIVNFWELLMHNSDERVRTDLFQFLTKYNMVINDAGYFIGYKSVLEVVEAENVVDETPTTQNSADEKLIKFVKDSVKKIKGWKKSPTKFVVCVDNGNFCLEKIESNKPNIGNLNDLFVGFSNVVANTEKTTKKVESKKEEPKQNVYYTDIHTKTMKINIGTPVTMVRKNCDSDPKKDCSSGLHIGTPDYAISFGSHNSNRKILICLVNPMNVVAVPEYDVTKLRTSEYIPIGVANIVNGKIDVVKESYLPNSYITHEKKMIEEMAAKIKSTQKISEYTNTELSINEVISTYKSRLEKLSSF